MLQLFSACTTFWSRKSSDTTGDSVYAVRDRARAPIVIVRPSKIAGVVLTDLEDECGVFSGPSTVAAARNRLDEYTD